MFGCCGYSIVEEKDAELLNEIKDDNSLDNLYLKKEGNKEAGEGTIEIVSLSKNNEKTAEAFKALNDWKEKKDNDYKISDVEFKNVVSDYCIIVPFRDKKRFLFINSEELLALSEAFKGGYQNIAKNFFNKTCSDWGNGDKDIFFYSYDRYYDKKKYSYLFKMNGNSLESGSTKGENCTDFEVIIEKINWKDFKYLVDEVAKKIMGKRMKEIQNSRINLKDSKNNEANYNYTSLDTDKKNIKSVS